MKATDYLATREGIHAMLSVMTDQERAKAFDMLRVICWAKLPDSRLKAAEELSAVMWKAAEREEQSDEHRKASLAALYGIESAGQRYPNVEA